jgi:hypothetical protein
MNVLYVTCSLAHFCHFDFRFRGFVILGIVLGRFGPSGLEIVPDCDARGRSDAESHCPNDGVRII